MRSELYHEPVLVNEVVGVFAPLYKARIIDATLGTGGHTLELVKGGADVLGIEADGEMLEVGYERLKKACPTPNKNGLGSFKLVNDNFRNIDSIAQKENFDEVKGVLFDLGVSNIQLVSPDRGFSFSNPKAKLDMRLDRSTQGLTGADLLNALREDHLINLFKKVLSFGDSRYLAKRIIEARERKPISTVGDFLSVTRGVKTKRGLNPATLPFLALRIAVNTELENLNEVLPKAFDLLTKGGRLAVIVFHSGEREIVLDFFFQNERRGAGKILTRRPIVPGDAEINKNPRARSATLYVLEKI